MKTRRAFRPSASDTLETRLAPSGAAAAVPAMVTTDHVVEHTPHTVHHEHHTHHEHTPIGTTTGMTHHKK